MSALPALDTAALGRTTIYVGDCRETLRRLPSQSVHCVVTSPPYFGLRDYQTGTWEGGEPDCNHKTRRPATAVNGSTLAGGKATTGHQQEGYRDVCARCGAVRVDRQIGLEASVDEYIDTMVDVFREVWRVLRDDGTLWLNIGDSYSGSGKGPQGNSLKASYWTQPDTKKLENRRTSNGIPAKNLMLIPWRLVLALQSDGWIVRSVIVWTKKAPMPESVTDRPSSAWEPIFLLTKRTTYFYDAEAVREPVAESTIGRGPVDFGGSKGHTYKADMGPDDPNYRNGSEQWGRTFDYTQSSANGRNQRNVWNLSPEPFSQWTETVRRVRVAWGDASDDTKRITSPDCPLHGDCPRPGSNAQHGEHVTVQSNRTGDSGGRHAQERQDAPSPTGQTRALDCTPCSLDGSPQPCSASATDHSNGNYRTGLAPETNQPCIAFVQTDNRTGGTSVPHGLNGSAERKHGSNTSPDGSDGLPSVQTPDHNASTSSSDLLCTCEYYKEITEKSSHFATFPTEIPRRAILAGTSAKGVCPQCGAPWMRVTRDSDGYAALPSARRNTKGYASRGLEAGNRYGSETPGVTRQTVTTGWQPSCRCNAGEPIPATVLDPFGGAGTTALAANRNGRNAILCELSPAYADMARRRLVNDLGMLADVTVMDGQEAA